MNSLQDSTSVKSRLQLVSKIAFTPNDLNKVVSFLKTWIETYRSSEALRVTIKDMQIVELIEYALSDTIYGI